MQRRSVVKSWPVCSIIYVYIYIHMLSVCLCWQVGQVFRAAVLLQVRYHSTFDLFCFLLPVPASGISLAGTAKSIIFVAANTCLS